MKVVIVGGVAGGATAAARIRRLDENAEIIIFERSGYVSYANCGLPYYIGGEIADKEDLFLQTPQGFWSRFKIDVRTLHEVTKINRERKTVTVLDKNAGNVFEENYDKLILSPGAKPVIPSSPNLRCGIFQAIYESIFVYPYTRQGQALFHPLSKQYQEEL